MHTLFPANPSCRTDRLTHIYDCPRGKQKCKITNKWMKSSTFSPTSCLPNPAASPFASLARVTGRATGCRSWPNATATMKCSFYRLHLVACWMIASVAPAIPWPHTGTGGSPRYTLADPTQTSTLSPRRAFTLFSFLFCLTEQLRFL